MSFIPSLPRQRRVPVPSPERALRPKLVCAVIFLGGLGVTIAAALGARASVQAETQMRFRLQAERLTSELERRMQVVEHVLKGTRATLQAAPDLSHPQFRAYIDGRETSRYFPGVAGLGVIEQVDAESAAAFVARQHALGSPGFSLRAAPQPGPMMVVRTVEPLEANAALVGWDLRADPARLKAVQEALRTGQVTLSGPVRFDASGEDIGWMVVAPATAAGDPVQLVFASLRIRDVMGKLAEFIGPWLDFQLFDGESATPATLLFDSRTMSPSHPPVATPTNLRRELPLKLGERTLILRAAATPALGLGQGGKLSLVIGLGGTLLSALLALASWLLMSAQSRARQLAAEMTADLQRMARVVERTSRAVLGLDLQGHILWANAGFERLTGLGALECVGRQASTLPEIAGVDPAARRELQVAILRREARRFEVENQLRDGVRYWTDNELQPTRDNEGRVSGFICIATDITRRKQAELRLQDSEHLMRIIADNLPGRVSYWDRDRRCRFVNRRFCEVFRRSPETLKGQPLSAEIFGEAFYEELLPHVERVLQGEPQYFEHEATDAAGRTTTWQLHYLPDQESGEVRGFFVLALDVTELRRARDHAVEASQAKSRFLSSMSHEIRTPLNAVMGMLALLRGTALDTRQRDYADKAGRAAQSLLALLNDILDLAKIEAGKMSLAPRVFALEDLLRDLSVIFAANVGPKDVEVLFELDPQLPSHLLADDLRLRQVLINLGGNAIKFTERGEVVLQIDLLSQTEGMARLRISVRDTGIGLSAQAQQRIFSDFDQGSASTAREFGGTGLGLGICQKLLALMGSRLQLESAPGQGSRFWFELDLPVPAQLPLARAPGAARRIHKVLMVDDNAEARESLGTMARGLGWVVDLASSAAEALALLAKAPAYDAVFIDWRMPDMDGWQVSARIRALPAGASAPLVVMVTAYGREMLSQRSEQEQALLDGFLVKPVTAAMLQDALERATAAPIRPATASAPARGSRPLAGMRLLLVEDNATNQQVAQELLASQGAEVDLAEDGRQGLERIRRHPERFDAVLMDVMMPVMDGHAAARAVREELGNWRLPIIAMTANALESDRVESLAAGMNDHVGKPFNIDELVGTLLRHVRPGTASESASAPVPLDSQPVPENGPAVLDVFAAVERLGGDQALYQRLVPSFAESLRGIAARLPSLLNSVPQPEAVRLLHTLKGSAATLGAQRLSEAAARAERLLKQDASPGGGADEALQEVAGDIGETLLALAALDAPEGEAAQAASR
ncbi:response regulator [Ramlibacter rhizophilus]|uniref:Virulence sensor protein BvgS n=1 Tax=Ramlibacter rhizophilus TaxID=1781167 RepID=A0A4Z0BHS4_9BURK|nr:response regulator [Ramlibacter rhizophilus]TFY98013.1 response regulator [Ramlibacter rhizophilus]